VFGDAAFGNALKWLVKLHNKAFKRDNQRVAVLVWVGI
jgi:hypothetical protein